MVTELMIATNHLQFENCLRDREVEAKEFENHITFRCRICKRLVLMPKEMNGVNQDDVAELNNNPAKIHGWLERIYRRVGGA